MKLNERLCINIMIVSGSGIDLMECLPLAGGNSGSKSVRVSVGATPATGSGVH